MRERYAIYCRVSDKGAKDAFGMDSQERECREYAERQGWDVVAVYQDWHTGTELYEHPEMSRVIAFGVYVDDAVLNVVAERFLHDFVHALQVHSKPPSGASGAR